MNKLILAAAALVAAPLVAQSTPMTMPVPGVQRDATHAGMGDHVHARADVIARTQRMFAMVDANHDGVLEEAETATARKRWDGPRHAGASDASAGGMPMDRNAMFDMMDGNRDGSISRDEFTKAHMQMHHGKGMQAGMDGEHKGGMARMWTMADANHDGQVTLKEATDLSLQHFDRMDTNHDGQVSPDERGAARAQMGLMRGQQ